MAERAAPPAPYYENSSGQNEFMAMGTNCRFTSAEIFPRVLGGGGGGQLANTVKLIEQRKK